MINRKMPLIKIDNREIEVTEGTVLIEAARQNGVAIPSLCHSNGLPHFSSCMVCMVREVKSDRFIPSCSIKIEEGMEIDASGEEVLKLRREALSMLLSEHRAECEAPCRLVCPSGLNIPLFNRLISSGRIKEARDQAFREMGNPSEACLACPRYCEKACRRKVIDQPVAISDMVIFLTSPAAGDARQPADATAGGTKPKRSERRFNSTLGKTDEAEKREWLRECPPGSVRHQHPSSEKESVDEAAACMHCDCRASEECQLRELCDSHEIKNPRNKKTAYPIRKIISGEQKVIFEHAKCIKCGLCVRVNDGRTNDPSLCFTGRGFSTILSEPITFSLDDIPGKDIDKAIDICPTGALTRK